VRVVNGARAATLTLNAGRRVLTLQALRPGRANSCAPASTTTTYPRTTPRASISPCSACARRAAATSKTRRYFRSCRCCRRRRYMPPLLAQSELIQLVGDLPRSGPIAPSIRPADCAAAYVSSNSDGDDGAPLTDYDLIGSEIERTGLFALRMPTISISCASRRCRATRTWARAPCWWGSATARNAARCLIVDPPSGWHTADDALRGCAIGISRPKMR
jgi:hypothetical protein